MKKIGVFIVLLAAIVFSGCVETVSVMDSVEDTNALVGLYKLKPLDPLYISFLGIPQEKQVETVIDEYGEITLPYLQEAVTAAGLTVSELEREIQRVYIEGDIYQTITINVQASSKSYFMEGEVMRPQEYPLNRRITLLQAIAAAGGTTEFANNAVVVTRGGENLELNMKKLRKNPELDIPIEAGDRIKVERSRW